MSQNSTKKVTRRRARKARATCKNEAWKARDTETCTYRLHLIHIGKTTNFCADEVAEGPCADFETVSGWAIEFGNSLIERCKTVGHDMPILATIKVYDSSDKLVGAAAFTTGDWSCPHKGALEHSPTSGVPLFDCGTGEYVMPVDFDPADWNNVVGVHEHDGVQVVGFEL